MMTMMMRRMRMREKGRVEMKATIPMKMRMVSPIALIWSHPRRATMIEISIITVIFNTVFRLIFI